jgi:PTS system fructose-specific IIC component
VSGISAPRVAIGISEDGIDFQAPSGVTAQVIVLVITPSADLDVQHDLLGDIESFLASQEFVEEIQHARTITEVFALVQVKRGERIPLPPV